MCKNIIKYNQNIFYKKLNNKLKILEELFIMDLIIY